MLIYLLQFNSILLLKKYCSIKVVSWAVKWYILMYLIFIDVIIWVVKINKIIIPLCCSSSEKDDTDVEITKTILTPTHKIICHQNCKNTLIHLQRCIYLFLEYFIWKKKYLYLLIILLYHKCVTNKKKYNCYTYDIITEWLSGVIASYITRTNGANRWLYIPKCHNNRIWSYYDSHCYNQLIIVTIVTHIILSYFI